VIIVVEGTDLSGKSTFVKTLREYRPDLELVKCSAPKPKADPFIEYEHVLYPFIDSDTPVVCDRLHWGERVYGPLIRGRDRLGVAGWRHVELFLVAHGAVGVYMIQDESTLTSRYQVRGDEHRTLHEILRARERYRDECLPDTILPWFTPDDTSFQTVQKILSRANWGSLKPPDPCYIGKPWPNALLFGEKRNVTTDRSAFVPRGSTSGRWLLEYLPDPFWRRIGITNACEDSDPVQTWEWAGRPPAVALGRKAHEALVKANVPHSAVPHPQYVRRFLHADLVEYGRLIESVVGQNTDHLKWRGERETEDLIQS